MRQRTHAPLILAPIILVLAVLDSEASHAKDGGAIAEGPRAVVARWLQLYRTGNLKEASAMTAGALSHRARFHLPFNRDTGVRVERSLGNQRVAAVVTNALKGANNAPDAKDPGDEVVLLFWLLLRDGIWHINKSDSLERRVVDERLRGFLEAGDVRWDLQRDPVGGTLGGHSLSTARS